MKKVVITLLAAVLIIGIVCGVVSFLTPDEKAPATVAVPTPINESSSPVPKPKVSKRPNTIRAGMWEVGVDVKPGKYRTSGAIDGLCYWHTASDDTDSTIITQGVIDKADEPGRVTLKKGQFFKTDGCSDWTLLTPGKAVEWFPTPVPMKNRKVYVIESLPASWPVSSAASRVDRYTGSNWVMAKKCPKGAYRCITVKAGNLTGNHLAETFQHRSSRVTIIVDLAYANSRVRSTAVKRWILAHEFGHAAGLTSHSGACTNLMYRSVRCTKFGVSASQKRVMSRR